MRVVSVVRSYLAMSSLELRRENLDAAAFVVFQSVRASMSARLLEAPPYLDDESLTEELTDSDFRYLVADSESAAPPLRVVRARAGRQGR